MSGPRVAAVCAGALGTGEHVEAIAEPTIAGQDHTGAAVVRLTRECEPRAQHWHVAVDVEVRKQIPHNETGVNNVPLLRENVERLVRSCLSERPTNIVRNGNGGRIGCDAKGGLHEPTFTGQEVEDKGLTAQPRLVVVAGRRDHRRAAWTETTSPHIIQRCTVRTTDKLGGPLVHIPPRNQVYAKYVFRCKVLK